MNEYQPIGERGELEAKVSQDEYRDPDQDRKNLKHPDETVIRIHPRDDQG
jgi:hypothetical protein